MSDAISSLHKIKNHARKEADRFSVAIPKESEADKLFRMGKEYAYLEVTLYAQSELDNLGNQ